MSKLRPKFPGFIFLFISAQFVFLGTTLAQNSGTEKIQDLKEKIQTQQGELKKSQRKKKEIYRELKKSEKAISKTNRRLYSLTKKQKILRKDLKNLEEKTSLVEQNIKSERQLLEKHFYHLYVNESGGLTPIKIILGSKNLTETSRQIRYLSYVSASRRELILKLEANLASLETLSFQKRGTEEKLKKLKKSEANQKKKLVEEKSKKQHILKKVNSRITRTKKSLKRDETALNRKIKELARAAEKRQRSRTIKNTKLPDRTFDGKSFKKLKGKLRLPALGNLKYRFGTQREGDILWKGVFIEANKGQPVKAIASGEVVYADWLGGFGNLLIIDHGGGYLSLYGNNESLLQGVGNIVKAGDTVATVGNTGGNSNSGLYFELRFKGKPFNPLKWVKF